MRSWSRFVGVVVAGAVVMLVVPLTAVPAQADVVPAVFLEQVVALGSDSVFAYSSANNDAFTFGPSTSQAGGVKITASSFTMQIAPASGSQLVSNSDLDATYIGGGTGAYASITALTPGTQFTCTHIAVHVKEVDRDGSGAITAFAASYKETCSATANRWGEVQYGVALPYGAVAQTTNASPGAFADTGVGMTRTKTVTLASRGTSSVTLGSASVSGLGASMYSLTNDTCAGATLAAGASCTLDVTFAPTSMGTITAQLRYAADSFNGAALLALYGNAKAPPSAPRVVAIPGDDGIAVVVYPGSTSNSQAAVTGFTVFRDDAPGTPLAQLPAGPSGTYVDSPMSPGTGHTYTAVANSDLGSSASSAPGSATVTTPAATAGSANRYSIDVASTVSGAASYVEQATLGATGVSSASFTGGSPSHGISISTVVNNTRLLPGDYAAPNAVPQVSLDPSLNPGSCSTTAVHVIDADIKADGTPEVLTASYVNDCGNDNVISGWIQWHSTAELVAAEVSPAMVDAGGVPVGQQGASQVVTVTNTGTTALLPQAASLSGTNPGDFQVTADTCAGQSVAPAGTCTVSVRLVPTAAHARSATLVIPDNTPAGVRRVQVSGIGEVVPSIPQGAVATPRTDRIRVSWIPPFDNGGSAVTSYNIYRGAAPDTLGTTPVAVVSGSTVSWDDTGLTPGTTYAYAVSAVNAAGEGTTMPTGAATVVSDELVFSHDLHGYGNYALVVGDASSGGLTTLLDDGHTNTAPTVSPDGTKVAFVSNNGGTDHVWVMPLDGSAAPTQLTTAAGADDFPSWSPDGTRIAYSHDNAGVWSIYTTTLVGAVAPVAGGQNADRPSFTPSGRELVVGSLVAPFGADVIGLDGSGRRHVTGSDNGVDPQVSPDGSTILMAVIEGHATDQCQNTYPVTHIATVPYVGGTATTIAASGGHWLDDPTWWPEGSKVSFDNTVLSGGCLSYDVIDTVGATGGLVSVRDGDSWGPAVRSGTVIARPVTPPAAPTALGATLTHGAVTLHWTMPATAHLWKVVVRRSAAGGAAPANLGQGTLVYSGIGSSVTASGLVDGSTYAFSVFVIDTSGSASAPVVWRATPLTAPKVTTPLVTATTATSYPFTVSWAPTSGTPTRYDVLYTRQGGTTGTWLSATTARSGVFGGLNKPLAVPAGSVWTFAARGRDAYGNVTAYSAAVLSEVAYDERWAGLHWSTGWSALSSSTGYLGTLKRATVAGSSVSAVATGRQFTLVGTKCTTCGVMRVYVDGVLKATVDTRATSTMARQPLWTSALYASAAKHTVRVVVVGTAGRPAVLLDAFAVR